jgi:rare lipoprotein A (peptidoglycan hydrolase)
METLRMMMQQAIGLSLALLVGSTGAMAKQVQPGHPHPVPSIKSKHAKVEIASGKPSSGKRHRARSKSVARSAAQPGPDTRSAAQPGLDTRQHAQLPPPARLPPPDRYIGSMQVVGKREIGSAAWYGGSLVGRRTATGERLDAVHATAAHRSLPLNSLVRVTNLSNGRSVIATINDRGPVSRSLLIDVSPSVADELDMKRAGIATVAVEPVTRTPSPPPH